MKDALTERERAIMDRVCNPSNRPGDYEPELLAIIHRLANVNEATARQLRDHARTGQPAFPHTLIDYATDLEPERSK